jgi:HTH-type transcriptional repressor of NAD biosynthesis genes
MFKHGLVIGKFYPPHRGHKYLIDTAVAQCESVTVIVCWKKSQRISGVLRAQWISPYIQRYR